jgi:hypothetical protein
MYKDDFTPEEHTLIERLQNMPQSRLNPVIHDKIKQQLMVELENFPVSKPHLPPTSPYIILVVIIIIIVIVAIIVTFMSTRQGGLGPATSTPTSSVTKTLELHPTDTSTPSVGPSIHMIPSATINLTPDFTDTPTETPTQTLQATLIPSLTPTEDSGSVIVIEGPVTNIDGNIITIFDIEIQMDSTDRILSTLAIGDKIRVIGTVKQDNSSIIVIATEITRLDSVIPENPDNPGLPPGCKITPKGKLHCIPKKK